MRFHISLRSASLLSRCLSSVWALENQLHQAGRESTHHKLRGGRADGVFIFITLAIHMRRTIIVLVPSKRFLTQA